MRINAVIFGCAGTELTRDEIRFFRDAHPWGFILFRRNIESPEQVHRLTHALRETVGRGDAPILVDQEGGRVQRLGPPHWRRYPPARAYGELAPSDPLLRREVARLGGRLMAHDLRAVGVTVNCLPVLDVPDPEGHEIIGDRAYGLTPDDVAVLGRAAAEGLIAGGVLPVIKHMPGHGRATSDSHLELPVVDTRPRDLEDWDFAAFKVLSDMPMAMTAHVVYSALDRKRPATTSRKVIGKIIREDIGFRGLLMTDDLSMKALAGGFTQRTREALAAGCDVALHCNGEMAEMVAVAEGVRALGGRSLARAEAALARIARAVEPFDAEAARARFDAAFEGRYAA